MADDDAEGYAPVWHPPVRPPRRGATAGEFFAATAVLLVLLAVFLWEPLTSPDTAYSSSDLLQSSPLVRSVPDDYRFGNVLLTDPVLQMHPWLEWNKDRLLDGDLPVWNPYNGAGAPHLANFVSAVLSPFSVPFYALPWPAALIVSAALKLLVLGLFTYLFLRKVAVSHLGGLVGAAGFMFAAYNVLWLAWPHPGAGICLPAGLYFAEVAIQATSRVRQRWAWCGYALAVLGAFLAGHPETLFFSWGLVLAYVPLRLVLSRELGEGRERLAKAGQFVVASVLAVGLAGVQLLPFAEYLQRSTAYEEGSERAQAHYDVGYSALQAFPDLFGAPSEAYHEPLRLVGALELPDGLQIHSNYNESVGVYVGLLVLLLAGVGALAAIRRRSLAGIFLVVAAVGWFVYVHDLGGIGHTVGALPLVELSAINRSHQIWAFAVCGLAAFGFDAVVRVARSADRGPRLAAAVGIAGAGTLVLAGAVVLARTTVERTDGRGGLVSTALSRASVDDHVLHIGATFLAGVVVLAVLAAFGQRRVVRVGAGLAVVAVVFAQSGFLLRDHNPTVDERLVYPSSPGLDAVAAAAGPGEDTVLLGNLLSPDANLWYRLRSVDSYDGMGVFRHDQLRRDMAALPAPLAGSRPLEVFGIRYVAAEGGGFPTALPAAPLPAQTTFTATLGDLHALTASTRPDAGGAAGACQVTVRLVDVESGAVAAESAAPCRQPFTTLSFPPIADSAGHTYSAVFSGADVLAFTPWASGVSGLVQVDGSDEVALFRAPASPARYFSPPDARPVASDDEARRLLADPAFAMTRTALVHGDVPATSGSEGHVEVLEQTATRVRLKVTRADPGWLVAIQTSFPGWTARVDGNVADVERADYVFTAVAVGPGTHEVLLRYRPVSVRYGMIVTGEALALMVIWLATARPRTRRGRRARIPWDPTKQPPDPELPG